MNIVLLAVLGLVLGSFVNAMVWRLHEQSKGSKASKLSVWSGRSMCPYCHHQLAIVDLVPLFSWLFLRGKCRYCSKPISAQYPLVELGLAVLFIASYVWWPLSLHGAQVAIFCLWLLLLTLLMALFVYDLRWYLLPNRLIYPSAAVALAMAVITLASNNHLATSLIDLIVAVAIGGGLFYLMFQLSNGRWIGGGDVKLGALLGLSVGTPAKAILVIFLASILGTLVSLPLLLTKRLKPNSKVAFGPLLIIGVVITVLFGTKILNWYQQTFIRI